jgi:hypothetical protein
MRAFARVYRTGDAVMSFLIRTSTPYLTVNVLFSKFDRSADIRRTVYTLRHYKGGRQ